jgi:hypothetical protein
LAHKACHEPVSVGDSQDGIDAAPPVLVNRRRRMREFALRPNLGRRPAECGPLCQKHGQANLGERLAVEAPSAHTGA